MNPENPISITPQDFALALPWAEATARSCHAGGRPLTEAERATATRVGVHHPERIHLMEESVPLPREGRLRELAQGLGLGGSALGLTLGYALWLARPLAGPQDRLLAHECRHVHQAEVAGGLAPFLATYLGEIHEFGYLDAPLEVDARAWETTNP